MSNDRVYVQHWQTFDGFTRPENTTAYAAGDVVSGATAAVMKFSKCAGQGGQGGSVRSVMIISSADQTTKLDADLWLFDAAPAIADDNAAFAPTDAEILTVVGVVSVVGTTAANTKVGLTTGTGNQVFINDGLDIPFACAKTDAALYGILVARNAYTPVSAEVFRIKLGVIQS